MSRRIAPTHATSGAGVALSGRPPEPTAEPSFLGREAELSRFEDWLFSPVSPLLAVVGPPGMGKSALLQAFAQRAEELGWSALRRGAPGTDSPEVSVDPMPVASLRPCVTFWDPAGTVEPWAPEMWPKLAAHVGRNHRLVWAGSALPEERWRAEMPYPVEAIHLDALSTAEAASFLRLRGLVSAALIDDVVGAVGGHPLGLVLAGNLAAAHAAPLVECSGWPRLRRWLVRHWLRGIDDPALIRLIEAAAQVHRFDQDLLLALVGPSGADAGFDRLLQLSFIHPAGCALTVHRDLRRILDADLRWRRPLHHAALRQRALEHYRRRWRHAPREQREALVADCLHLCDEPAVHALCFAGETPDVRGDPGGAADHPTLRHLWSTWVSHTFGIEPLPDEVIELQRILDAPGTRLRVIRDREGAVLGFSAILAVSSESVAVLQGSHVAATLIQACWNRAELAALAQSAEASVVFFIHHMAWVEWRANETIAALLQDALGLLALGGVYLASAAHPGLQRLLVALGFRRVDAAVNPSHDPVHPVLGYELDLSASGCLAWLEDLYEGRLSGGVPRVGELERDLQNMLARWSDDAWLARSPATRWPALAAVESGRRRVGALRSLVGEALREALAAADDDEKRALRAVELAYLNGAHSHKVAAAELGVSRATFYRLLPRGVALLAECLRHVLRHPPEF